MFISDRSEGFSAVREVAPDGQPELVIYVENAGDFIVRLLRSKQSVHRKLYSTVTSWGIVYDRRLVLRTMRSDPASEKALSVW